MIWDHRKLRVGNAYNNIYGWIWSRKSNIWVLGQTQTNTDRWKQNIHLIVHALWSLNALNKREHRRSQNKNIVPARCLHPSVHIVTNTANTRKLHETINTSLQGLSRLIEFGWLALDPSYPLGVDHLGRYECGFCTRYAFRPTLEQFVCGQNVIWPRSDPAAGRTAHLWTKQAAVYVVFQPFVLHFWNV